MLRNDTISRHALSRRETLGAVDTFWLEVVERGGPILARVSALGRTLFRKLRL